MGVADRVYMRRSAPGALPAGRSVTLIAIVVLVAAYVVQNGSRGWFHADLESRLVLSWPALREGRVWTLFTAALLHAGVWHLAMNALCFWFFGRLVEETLGSARYAWFLVLAAVLSHVPFVLWEAATGDAVPTIGASGVVMAALVFAAFRFPNLPVTLVFIPMRLWMLAALYVGLDVLGAVGRGASLIDHWTHLGGAAYGFLVHRFGLVPSIRLPRRTRRSAPEGGPYADAIPARIDALLDKINAKGIAALTPEEREFLKRHSGRYR